MNKIFLLIIVCNLYVQDAYSQDTREQNATVPLTQDNNRPVSERQPVLENPIAFSMSNIKRGKQLYAGHCALCHGGDGSGDTQMREFLKIHPANFLDQRWTYGARDGDLFKVIKQGKIDRDMPAFAHELTDERIWQTIHYIRYLGGKRPQ